MLRLVLTRALRTSSPAWSSAWRGRRHDPRAADVPVRGDADRSDRVHDRHAAADGGGTDGGVAARAPRDKDRPVRRAARGISVNGSDPSGSSKQVCGSVQTEFDTQKERARPNGRALTSDSAVPISDALLDLVPRERLFRLHGTPSRAPAPAPPASAAAAVVVRPPGCARAGSTRSRCRPGSAGPS